ncbi:MAG: DUF47 family protein [Solirubrobacterales bacterium]
MSLTRWFLPEEPDVIGLLRAQLAVTLEALEAFADWANGNRDAGQAVRDAEPRGDQRKRELVSALRAAFVIPLEPEDVFALSRGIDQILDFARDLVAEAEVLDCMPDEGIATMAELMGEAVRHLDVAVAALGTDDEAANAAAEATISVQHHIGDAYYGGMANLLHEEDMRSRIKLRELYRRCSRIGEVIIEVAERIMYAIVKQS